MNIFIVEDDQLLLLMLNRMITKMGHSVAGTATNGYDAIAEINKTTPDLILMDIILKDEIDGITVAETVKKQRNYPIIYITGNSDSFYKNRADAIGYHDYLVKPTSFEKLVNSINKLNQKTGSF
ncbi:MAG: response regulator [Balneolaceae bacterium]|nr:MAG: response regulator [Balneolaceae bacterium]